MGLYKIYNLPAFHPELKVEFTYELEGEYLAITKNKLYAALPTAREIRICKGTGGYLCLMNQALNVHLERMDKKTSITSVTISEIRSQVHKIESTIEESYEKIPEPNSPSWIFPGDIVELHAPDDDIIFHDESDDETSTNREQQQEENLTISGETQEEHGNIPHGLSPPRQYVPAGAEGDEANSSTPTYGEEATVEEELANYFSNPSYRAANPELLEPVDSEEDWGDVSPVPPPPRTQQELPQQTAKSEKSPEVSA